MTINNQGLPIGNSLALADLGDKQYIERSPTNLRITSHDAVSQALWFPKGLDMT